MNLKDFIVSENTTIIESMRIIDENGKGIVFVCEEEILLAAVTDGDIRRYILRNGDLNRKIKSIANYKPKYKTKDEILDYKEHMKFHGITALPIVADNMKLLTIHFLNASTLIKQKQLKTPVIIMAGGKGTRLFPYTQILPKPLIPIGEKTITELIMDQFERFGCDKFHMIVNYKKNFIKAFYLDNEEKRNISFVDEEEFLGTGGGLKLLENDINETVFVTNCDILVEEDYSEILNYHKSEHNMITIVAATKHVTIPYGTIEISETGSVKNLKEKPSFNFLTNTGLYIIEPEFIKQIPDNTFIHITDLIQNCIDKGQKVGMYPIGEHSWMDMGQLDDLEKMRERVLKNGK